MEKIKKIMKLIITLFFAVFLLSDTFFVKAQQNLPSAKKIVKKADEKMRGETLQSEMTMKIVRPKWSRTVTMKMWAKDPDYSLILITAPAKEKGQVFLKRKTEMWNWVPSIERMIKIPPSMMTQSWMGSDFTNDDLLQQSSIVNDYTHTLIDSETIQQLECYKIKLIPKPDAPVVWGKIIMWISKKKYHLLKTKYYDEDGYLVNIETMTNIKIMDNREIPTKMEITPVDEKGHKTIIEIKSILFNKSISDDFFSQQNMKRVR